jgi:hypothetical protein
MCRNACSILIIAGTIVCLFNTDNLIVSSTLNLGFSIGPSAYSIEYCRFRMHSAKICVDLLSGLLVLASVDRAGQLHTTTVMQKRDRQLIVIIMLQVIFFTALRVSQIAMIVYLQATTTIVKSVDQVAIESFLSYLFQFLTFTQQTCLVFIHLMSTTFRAELKNILTEKKQQHGERATAVMELPM